MYVENVEKCILTRMKYPTRNHEKNPTGKMYFFQEELYTQYIEYQWNSCQNHAIPAGKTLELCKLVWQEKNSCWNFAANAAFVLLICDRNSIFPTRNVIFLPGIILHGIHFSYQEYYTTRNFTFQLPGILQGNQTYCSENTLIKK